MVHITLSRRALIVAIVLIVMLIPLTAMATHLFLDVNDQSVHFDGISWMGESGVTQGCGNGNYCPGDAVTREQMATFMYRLSGNDPDTAPSVNAASVGGIAADGILHSLVVVEESSTWTAGPGDSTGFGATCPEGTTVIGGGANESGQGFLLTDSYPSTSLNSWQGSFEATVSSTGDLSIFAICATVGG